MVNMVPQENTVIISQKKLFSMYGFTVDDLNFLKETAEIFSNHQEAYFCKFIVIIRASLIVFKNLKQELLNKLIDFYEPENENLTNNKLFNIQKYYALIMNAHLFPLYIDKFDNVLQK